MHPNQLKPHNLHEMCRERKMFKTADDLTLRAPDRSVMQKLPAAKEAKQRPPPRNHCRPVLKGAPFIVCSGCFKLVQVPADFAVFTKKVHKLRCGFCSAVLSYAYRVPARKKTYQKSIDQLRSIADAALLLLEVFGAPRRELGRSSNSWLETGTLFGGFQEPKTSTKYLMKNVVTRQGLDTYTWSSTSTLTEEDSFDPHKYSYRQVEKSQSSFYEDLQAWFAMENRYGEGLGHHACMQQVGPKLLGRNDMRQMIMEKVLLDRNGGRKCTVICINAGSGHGKTSLLHALYNDQVLTDTFDKSIWIQLSAKSDMLMLFKKIVDGARAGSIILRVLGQARR